MPWLWERTECVIRMLYRRGCRYFLCGGATGFDMLAAAAVLHLRETNPDAVLGLALPCADQTRGWTESAVNLYEQQRAEADRVVVLSPHYYTGCMMVRNRFLVDHAAFCVAYMEVPAGGTAFTVRYALHEKLPVLNLAMPDSVTEFAKEEEAGELPF